MCEDKRKIIAYLWYLNAILSLAYVCVAIAVAARNNAAASGNKAAGFAAIWSMFILLLIIVGGTLTMKKVRCGPSLSPSSSAPFQPFSPRATTVFSKPIACFLSLLLP